MGKFLRSCAIIAASAMAMVAAVAGCFALPETVFADDKINSVSVRFIVDDFEEGVPVVEIETGSKKYEGTVSTAYEYSGGDGYDEDDTNTYIVELTAEDGWYFSVTKSNQIRLSGGGAKFVKASRQNNGQTLIITAELEKLAEYVEEVNEPMFRNDGYGEWEPSAGALTYKVLLTSPNGRRYEAVTGGTSYDFRPFMQKEGSYEFRVKAISKTGNSTVWSDSGSLAVTKEAAEANRAVYEVKKEISFLNDERTPANQVVTYLNTGWQMDEEGRTWYRNTDGSYPQSIWMEEGGKWYFFDGSGYLVKSNYVEWGGDSYYTDETGAMVTGQKTPDGRKAGEDGVLEK